MKSLMITGMSFALTSLVIGNAYYQKQQFYPSVVYITKSNPSMAVIYIQALVFVILTAKLLRKLFFGQLRAAEMEHLIERSWYAVTETCLAFTVFRDDFSPRFVALFTLLLFLKCFHWLAEDRIDYMERSPAISWLFHLRALSLIFVLAMLDLLFVRHAFYSTILKGPSVQLVFGFEYEILFTVVLMTFIKYILHTIDLQSENPWDNKAMYLLYSELIMGSIRVLLYILFFAVMVKVHTFPLFAIRPMYLTLRAFQKAASDVILSRRAIRNMNTLYPDATPEELNTGDNLCIICREEMTSGCKKLPCNHILHTNCLRSWFQRQQTCPTCRLEVLRMPQGNTQRQQQQQQGEQPQQAQQQQQPGAVQNPFNNMQGLFGGLPFQWPPPNMGGQHVPPPFGWPPQQQQQQQQQQQPQASTTPATTTTSSQSATTGASATGTATTTTTASSPSATASPGATPVPPPPPPFGMGMPPFSGMPPFMSPSMMPPMFSPMGFPPPPRPMEGLSDEELRAMEGTERANVQARVAWLRDIQTLLDGAMVLIGQYNTVASHMGSPGISPSNPPHPNSYTPAAPTATSSAAAPSSPVNPEVSLPSTSSSSSSSSSSASASSSSQQQQPTWWPAGQGARPKYTSPPSNVHSHNSSTAKTVPSVQAGSDNNSLQAASDGASAMSTEQVIPKWEDSREGENEDEESMQEIRKRRCQRFEQSAEVNSSQKTNGTTDSS